MESLTEADIAELHRFAEELSKPHMPVTVRYEPEPPHLILSYQKPSASGLSPMEHRLGITRLDELKKTIKRYAGS